MNTSDLSKYDNSWYQPGGKIKRALWHIINHLFVKTHCFHIKQIKIFILKLFGAKIGKHVNIKPGVNIKYPWFLEIGENTWIGENVWIDNLAKVSIGKNVCLSQGAMLLCGNHNYKKPTFDLMVQPIALEDGVWIGAQSVVCPGITCHSHAVLSVGSVATGNLDPYTIYSGNPAQKVKERIINQS